MKMGMLYDQDFDEQAIRANRMGGEEESKSPNKGVGKAQLTKEGVTPGEPREEVVGEQATEMQFHARNRLIKDKG